MPSRNTAPIAVCVAGDGEPAERTLAAVRATAPDTARLFEDPARDLDAIVAAIAAAHPLDVVILTAGAEPGEGWLRSLRAAAHADTTIASASAMLLGATLQAPDGMTAAVAARSVADTSARVHPRIPEPAGTVVLLRRAALDAAGSLEPELGSLPAALAAWAERCTERGLGHVLADDVAVAGTAPAAAPPATLAERWPHRRLYPAVAADSSALERAVGAARRGFVPLSVTLDGRSLTHGRGGTQVHALELAASLLRTERVRLRVVVPPDLSDFARAALTSGGAELLPYDAAAGDPPPPTDVAHRPSQVFSADDLALIVPLGRRVVITHQDLIAYRIPGYHETPEHWERFRAVTRDALGAADHVVFFSRHALADALADDLLDPAHASVVPIGVDHRAAHPPAPRAPVRFPGDGAPHLLCLGTDLLHKQRPFAIRLLAALRRRGWAGRLVLAGGHVPNGSSAEEQRRLLAADPDLAASVVDLGPVGEAERAWLMENAAAVAYPTLYEGFGLVPFESAAAGVPALFASQTSLADVLPRELAVLRPWDAEASADAALRLLTDPAARLAHVEAVRAIAADLTWDRTAHALVDRYERLVAAPAREAVAGPRARMRLHERLQQSERIRQADANRFAAYTAAIGADGLGLVGPGGLLDARDQRALLAIASRRGPRSVLFSALRALYRVAHRAP